MISSSWAEGVEVSSPGDMTQVGAEGEVGASKRQEAGQQLLVNLPHCKHEVNPCTECPEVTLNVTRIW